MTILVLCNVGRRDVGLVGETSPILPPREAGQKILEDYEAVAPRLTFPIIEPCLQYIAAQHPDGIDLLVLYGTDQEDAAHSPSDTLHFATLAARRLPTLLPGKLRNADASPVRGINPALYDETFEKYDQLLAELPALEVEFCYVIITGGVPACNAALLLQGVRHFAGRLRVVYLPQGGEPQELRAGQQVSDAFLEAAAVEHLQRLDFANAQPQLERVGADRGLLGLTTYAAQRLAFDFGSAQSTLLATLRDGERPVRDLINERLRHDLDPLLQEGAGPERLAVLLRELYWNAAITYRHRRYADFLGRVYRFQEAILRYLVETVYGLATDLGPADRERHQQRWNEAILANAPLAAFLDTQEIEGRPLDGTKIGRPTYKALMNYAANGGLDSDGQPLLAQGVGQRYAALLERVNAFDRLVEQRHRTIIGHDFEGVSERSVLAHYKGTSKQDGVRRTPLEGMKEILGMLYIDVRTDPYQVVAEFVIKALRRR